MSLTKYGCLEQDQSRKEHIFHVNVGHFPFSVYITHNTVNNNMIMRNRSFHSPAKGKPAMNHHHPFRTIEHYFKLINV